MVPGLSVYPYGEETRTKDRGERIMDLAAKRQARTVRLRRLGNEMTALRAGLPQAKVTEATGINAATLYRIENGIARPQPRTLKALLDLYGVTDEARRKELLDLAKQASQPTWWQQYEPGLTEQYSTYIGFETEAEKVFNYESLFVPGLLQTEAYARAVIHGVLPSAAPDEIEMRVEARMRRQAALTNERPLRLWTIVDEAVICRRVGGAGVMVDQLHRLCEVAKLPTVTIQLLPFDVGAHPGMTGSFVLMEFLDEADPALVYIDSMAGDLFLERASDVKRYRTMMEHLQASALPPAESIRRIARQAETIASAREV